MTQQEADSIQAGQAIKSKVKKDEENQHGIPIGSRALQISGLIQTRYQGFAQPGVNNSFDLHRAGLDVKGDIGDKWSYEIYTDFAGTVKLLDAFTTCKLTNYLKFTAGQFKVPFSHERLTPDSQLEFIDRSQVDDALSGRTKDVIGNQNGRDIGIQVGGSFTKIEDHYLFDYTFGVFNGAGFDVTSDNNSTKDIAGRFTVHPVKNLSISADFYNGEGFYGSPATNQTRNGEGFDASYVSGALSLTAEYDKGTGGTIKRNGWYAQAGYFVISKKLQFAVKYHTYDPGNSLTTNCGNWYIAGINYFFNEWTKLTVDYCNRSEHVSPVKNNLSSVQLQLTF